MKDVYEIKTLKEVRLLADPLKLKLIQAFAEAERTTKDVATELGESVTKLYRHVDALLDAGLLIIVNERQKRGTIERTLRAVAQRFEVDHALFADTAGSAGLDSIRDVLRTSEAEILNAISNPDTSKDEQAIVMRIRGRATPEKIAELRESLTEWLESIPNCDDDAAKDAKEIGGLIAFYQID